MRILYVCHRVPYPPDKGDKIRAFHEIQAIAATHEVDLFTLADDQADLVHRAALSRLCRAVTIAPLNPRIARLRSLPYLCATLPLTVPYFHSAKLQCAMQAAMGQRSYDRIFVYCSAMAQYVERVEGPPLILDLVDVDSDKWKQYASHARFPFSVLYRREWRRLREYERRICAGASAVLVSTEREGQIAREIADSARVHVVSNGVDVDYFKPDATPASPQVPTVVFTGDMSYFPNEEAVAFFARRILPMVRKLVPGTRFLIVGRAPSRKVRELCTIEGVDVTGFVPDIRTYLAQAQVSVAPLAIAAGIQNKILEAMATGLPVVATSRTLQGLTPNVAQTALAADEPEQFATEVVRLLRDPRRAREAGLESRRQVVATYSWSVMARRILELLDQEGALKTSSATIGHLSYEERPVLP